MLSRANVGNRYMLSDLWGQGTSVGGVHHNMHGKQQQKKAQNVPTSLNMVLKIRNAAR